jgi:hypothetical protein
MEIWGNDLAPANLNSGGWDQIFTTFDPNANFPGMGAMHADSGAPVIHDTQDGQGLPSLPQMPGLPPS